MSDYDRDVYYAPEKHGLTPVAEIDYSSGSYEFDIRVVWKHLDGTLYTARDSGCSCPSPFESYTSLSTLTILNEQVLGEIEDEGKREGVGEHTEFIEKVRHAFKTAKDEKFLAR